MAEVKKGVLDELEKRGLVKQVVYEDDLKAMLDSGPQSFYIGFDPTADSLHVGHFMQMILAKRLQDAGHRPIILIGGWALQILTPTIFHHPCGDFQPDSAIDFAAKKA